MRALWLSPSLQYQSVVGWWEGTGDKHLELGGLFLGKVPLTSSVTLCKALGLSEPLCRMGVVIFTCGPCQARHVNRTKCLRKSLISCSLALPSSPQHFVTHCHHLGEIVLTKFSQGPGTQEDDWSGQGGQGRWCTPVTYLKCQSCPKWKKPVSDVMIYDLKWMNLS